VLEKENVDLDFSTMFACKSIWCGAPYSEIGIFEGENNVKLDVKDLGFENAVQIHVA
jgi:hypothetical protein